MYLHKHISFSLPILYVLNLIGTWAFYILLFYTEYNSHILSHVLQSRSKLKHETTTGGQTESKRESGRERKSKSERARAI